MLMNIHWHPNDRHLRQFGMLCMLLSAVLLVRWRTHQATLPALIAAVALLLLGLTGLFKPRVLRPLYVGWMIAVFPISWTITKLILGLLFYGVFTPLGLCFRVLGRDALGLKLQPETESYWIPKEGTVNPSRYFQQF